MLNGKKRFTDMLSRPGRMGGTTTAHVGVGVEAPRDGVAVTTGGSWRNTVCPWRGLVAKQDMG